MIRFFKNQWRLLLGVFLLLTVITSAWLYWFVQSGRIEAYIAERAKFEVEHSLGAKLTLGRIEIDFWRGRAVIASMEIRGREPASAAPLFSANEVRLAAGIASFSKSKIDLRSLQIKDPKIHIITFPDGSTNLPTLKNRTAGPNTLAALIDLRLGRLEMENGEFQWDEQRTPFALRASDFKTRLDYLVPSRSYRGILDANALSYRYGSYPEVAGSVNTEFGITADGIRIDRGMFRSGPSTVIEAHGDLTHVDTPDQPLRVELEVDATIAAGDALAYVKMPIEPAGTVTYKGQFLFEAGRGIELHGDARGRDLYYRDASTRLGPIRAVSRIDVLPARLTLSKLRADAFGGSLEGDFLWDLQEGWRFDGDVNNVNIGTVLGQLNVKSVPWSGEIHGPVAAQGGRKPLQMTADLEIQSTDGPSPLEGLLALTYEEGENRLLARNSYIALPHSRVNFAGDLGKGIALEFNSTAMRELLPVLEFAGISESQIPINLQRGSLTLAGQLTGTVKSPRFRGMLEAQGIHFEDRQIERIRSRIDFSEQLLALSEVEVEALGGILTGDLRMVLEEGRIEQRSLLSGSLTVNITDLSKPPFPVPAAGSLRSTIIVRGTWADPALGGTVQSPSLAVRDLQFGQFSATFSASRKNLSIGKWEARLGSHPVQGNFHLTASTDGWVGGTGNALLKVDRLPLLSIAEFRKLNASVDANLTADTEMDFLWTRQGIAPNRLDGKLTLANISRFNRPIGQLEFTSRTSAKRAAMTVTGMIQQLPVKGDASIQLDNGLESELRLQLPQLDFPTIAQLFSREILPSPLPYEGGAEASFFFKGPLINPQQWDGHLTIPRLQLAPNKDYVRESMPAVADFVVRNDGPIVVEFRRGLVGARDVRLVAKNTNLTATLLYQTGSRSLTGQAKGTINLAALSTLKPDLLASGTALLDTNIQGSVEDPQLNGRLSFKNASFYLRDVITGLDKVNGTVLFDRSRATIESLEAQTGGGNLQLTGFVGFGRILSYRLQAQANQVRLRYPEGISTSANANLALTGTTAQSILTGNVTILRSSIGQIDTAQLLVGNSEISGTPTPISNEFLRNLQFDVRVEAAQNVEFSTAFTKDVKGEIALRLRGTPQRLILLGRIAVTQGEVDFFGARYQISRGEVNFTNPLRIEPIVALDLETKVRGVAIAINFTGPASKLNMSYRSDPPLQSNEILALLTVGRNPGSTSPVAQGPVGQNRGMFGNDSSVIVGAAVSAGINGRLQRFFGISRVRLDPQLTGIDNVPQARLTLEQQVSRDVTLTYITNLNRTQQQIVRIDWDISRAWSVVAVRDENGIFGLDLFFRRRVK